MIIAVDFDGTLCDNNFPYITNPKIEVIKKLRTLKEKGHRLILWTCREGEILDQAVEWCKSLGLEFDSVNENIPELMNGAFGYSKVIADFYYDDKNLSTEDLMKL